MNRFILLLTFILLRISFITTGQSYAPFINDSFESYLSGSAATCIPEWSTCNLSGISYNDWRVDTLCNIAGSKSLAVTSQLHSDCIYEDGDNSHQGSVILFSKKVKMNPRFKNVSLVFNWKAGGASTDYGMVAYSTSGNFGLATDWVNVTNTFDGTAYGKYYNRSAIQFSSANMKDIIYGDSVRVGFRWITNQDGNVNAPGWIIDNVVLCALGEINSSLGDSIAPGVMSRLTITGYTGNIVQWERYSGGQWIYLAGSTDSYSTPINLPEGENTFRVKIQNGIQETLSEKTLYVSNSFSINELSKDNMPFNIYPNPGDGNFEITKTVGRQVHLIITDSKSALVYKTVIGIDETLKKIDLSFLQSGNYFCFDELSRATPKKLLIIRK